MSEWPLVRVADIANNIAIGPFGSRMKSDCYISTGVPVIRGTNLTGGKTFSGDWVYVSEKTADSLGNCCVTTGDLVFPHRGAIGEVGIVTDDFPRYVMSSSLMKLTCNRTKADPVYVYYFFKSKQGRHELLKNASQVGTPGIGQPLTSLKGIDIPLPPLSVQRDIARILGDLDDKIELNRQINQTLEQIAQTIFKSWFVDFEPVKAKIEAKAAGRDPERAAMCAISGKCESELDQLPPEQYQQLTATAALFPNELVDSELGLIPKGWFYRDLEAICQFTAGSAFKPEYQGQSEGQYPFIKVSDMNLTGNEVFIRSAQNYIFEPQRKTMGATLHPSGATVFAKIGVALLANRRRLLRTPTIIDNNLMSASPRSDANISCFLYLLLSSIDFTVFANGTALPYLNVSDLKKIQVVFPSDESSHAVMNGLNEIVQPLFEAIYSSSSQSETLECLRDSLLPRLLSGDVAIT